MRTGAVDREFRESMLNVSFACFQEGRYSFPEEEWSHISHEAKELIRQLLVREASHRLSAERVLQHPWLRRADPHAIYPPLHTPTNIKRLVARLM